MVCVSESLCVRVPCGVFVFFCVFLCFFVFFCVFLCFFVFFCVFLCFLCFYVFFCVFLCFFVFFCVFLCFFVFSCVFFVWRLLYVRVFVEVPTSSTSTYEYSNPIRTNSGSCRWRAFGVSCTRCSVPFYPSHGPRTNPTTFGG